MKLFPISVKQSLDPKNREMIITFTYLAEDGNIYVNDVFNNVPDDFVTKSVQDFPQGSISKMNFVPREVFEKTYNVSLNAIVHNYQPFPFNDVVETVD